jgi:protein TonB
MNAVAESPAGRAVRARPPVKKNAAASSRPTYTIGLLAAVSLHALILFGVKQTRPAFEQAEFSVEAADASVEVSLVAALPAEEPPPSEPPPPEPTPAPPEAITPPVEQSPSPEMPPQITLPEPESTPPPRPRRPEPPRVQKEKPKTPPAPRPSPPIGDGSSPIPGNDAITARSSPGADSARPGYLSNPHPAYPEAARVARQQGVVTLRVGVDASGRVAGVQITRSSGFPLLDERAQNTVSQRWRFKPARAGGVPVASEVVVPIRFTLAR